MAPAEQSGREELAQYIIGKLRKEGAEDCIVSSLVKNSLLVKFSNNKINTTKRIKPMTFSPLPRLDVGKVSNYDSEQ